MTASRLTTDHDKIYLKLKVLFISITVIFLLFFIKRENALKTPRERYQVPCRNCDSFLAIFQSEMAKLEKVSLTFSSSDLELLLVSQRCHFFLSFMTLAL